jgi:hypothetical protein
MSPVGHFLAFGHWSDSPQEQAFWTSVFDDDMAPFLLRLPKYSLVMILAPNARKIAHELHIKIKDDL